MSPLPAAICVIWIGVWKGPPYLSVILVGGSMDVSIGCRLVLHDSFGLVYRDELWVLGFRRDTYKVPYIGMSYGF